MKNVLIINAHEHYPFSEGKLNNALVDRAMRNLSKKGYEVRLTTVQQGYETDAELEHHRWADAVILQTPVNWMGVPWRFKQYMDIVYSAGMAGVLSDGDGRTRSDTAKQYGAGGTLVGKRYLISLTFNAPEEAFNDPDQYLFQGRSVDDLFLPMHMNFRFFGMEAMDTFACYDVLKNPDIENDFVRFEAHLDRLFAPVVVPA